MTGQAAPDHEALAASQGPEAYGLHDGDYSQTQAGQHNGGAVYLETWQAEEAKGERGWYTWVVRSHLLLW